MAFKYFGVDVSPEFILNIIENNKGNLNGCIRKEYIYHAPIDQNDKSIHLFTRNSNEAIDIEFVADDFDTHQKVQLFMACPEIVPYFHEYDQALLKFILYSNGFPSFDHISMPINIDVVSDVVEWYATVPQFNTYMFEDVGKYIKGLNFSKAEKNQLIDSFWQSFGKEYGEALSVIDIDNPTLSIPSCNSSYMWTPVYRFITLFGNDWDRNSYARKSFLSFIKKHNVIPPYVKTMIFTHSMGYMDDHHDLLKDMMIEGSAIALYSEGIDERMSLMYARDYQLKKACEHVIDNKDDRRIKNAINKYKIKYGKQPLEGIL